MCIKTTKKIYLSGATARQYWKFIKGWRNRSKQTLSDFIVIDITTKEDKFNPEECENEQYHLIEESNLVIAEMGIKGYPYIATAMEILYARQRNIPVYVWPDLYVNHKYVTECAELVFDDLNGCLEYVKRLGYWK